MLLRFLFILVIGGFLMPVSTTAQCFITSGANQPTIVDFITTDQCGAQQVHTVDLQAAPTVCPTIGVGCDPIQSIGVSSCLGTFSVNLVSGQSLYKIAYGDSLGCTSQDTVLITPIYP